MREALAQIGLWRGQGKKAALATVVKAWGSSPRPLGANMAISSDGEMVGSVSGGCVEGAVVEEALGVLASGEPKLVEYGVSDDLAWSVGLSCGGTLEVFIEPVDQVSKQTLLVELEKRLAADETVGVATILNHAGSPWEHQALLAAGGRILAGGFATEDLGAAVREAGKNYFSGLRSGRESISAAGTVHDVFFEIHPPPPQIIITGAVHVAIHLIAFAKQLGYRTVVIDPRTAFATRERFAGAEALLVEWPDAALSNLTLTENTHFVMLAHDLKIDLPAIEIALRSPARYIGALGSKKTHEKRFRALEERGFSPQEIARIHNPIGLDLGGRKAVEIALAIISEIVAAGHGRA